MSAGARCAARFGMPLFSLLSLGRSASHIRLKPAAKTTGVSAACTLPLSAFFWAVLFCTLILDCVSLLVLTRAMRQQHSLASARMWYSSDVIQLKISPKKMLPLPQYFLPAHSFASKHPLPYKEGRSLSPIDEILLSTPHEFLLFALLAMIFLQGAIVLHIACVYYFCLEQNPLHPARSAKNRDR